MSDVLSIQPLPDMGDFPSRPLMKKNVIPAHPHFSIFIGMTGSGKTTLLANLFTNPHMFKGYYKPENVYLLGATCKADPSFEYLIDQGMVEKENVTTQSILSKLEKIVSEREKQVEAEGKFNVDPMCIILEDITGDFKLLRSDVLAKLAVQCRHLNCSVFCAAHKFKSLKPVHRANAHTWLIFPLNQHELEALAEELTPPFMNKKQFMSICNFCWKTEPGKRNFMFINNKREPDKKFSKNFDTIVSL